MESDASGITVGGAGDGLLRERDADDVQAAAPPSQEQTLIARAAAAETLSESDVDALTAFFLGDRRMRPGEAHSDVKTYEVALTPGTTTDLMRVTVGAISWEEWQAAQQNGTIKVRGAAEEEPDELRVASYVVAMACKAPDLGAVRMGIPEDRRPADTAALLRDFFRKQPGIVLQLRTEVLRMSRLLINDSALKEVDAGKL